MKFEVLGSRGNLGHSEVVSAQAETGERQAPCTADNQVPNFLCRERSPRRACRVRALYGFVTDKETKGGFVGSLV